MKHASRFYVLTVLALVLAGRSMAAEVAFGNAKTIFETTSAYHHILVVEENFTRIMCFDDAQESRMSMDNPLLGHFEYTEYFHMPWLWKTNISKVLMVGLGGGSTQRLFEHYYTNTTFETVEIDPVVVQVAKNYFQFKENNRQKVYVEDGRMFLRRSTNQWDLILMDAYVQSRYGSSIPQHLATKEYFEIISKHLPTNGVLSYNIIGDIRARGPEIVGAIYKTMNAVFPQVYVFPADTSYNVVLVATKEAARTELPVLRARAQDMVKSKLIQLPNFTTRLDRMRPAAPTSAARSPVLTDDYAPVEGLASPGQ
jgi:spermidine synthase